MSRTAWMLAGLLGFLFASCSDNEGALDPPLPNDSGGANPTSSGASGAANGGSPSLDQWAVGASVGYEF